MLAFIDASALARLRAEVASLRFHLAFKRCRLALKYNPDQPRVPAGNPDGGQWTDGVRVAQSGPGRGWARGVLARFPGATPGQAARLAATESMANRAIARVKELDPAWRPMPRMREGIEGAISVNEAQIDEANARYRELQRVGVAPGPFAGESIPTDGPGRDFTAPQRREINRIGSETGCHTCGTTDPRTLYGDFVPDHQPPSAMNPNMRPQRLFPQCLTCSLRQGGWIGQYRRSQ